MKFTTLLFFLCFATYTQSQTDCAKFKTGTFVLPDDVISKRYLIKRTKTKQKEEDMLTGEKFTFEVRWLDSCTYALRPLKGNKDMLEYFAGKILYITINSTTEDQYTFFSRFENEAGVSGTMVKIK